MRLRRSTAEHPFATLKYQIFGHPRFLLRGRRGAQAEMSLAVIAYNLKRMMNVLGRLRLAAAWSQRDPVLKSHTHPKLFTNSKSDVVKARTSLLLVNRSASFVTP